MTNLITPYFSKNNIPVVLASDNNYTPFVAVTIHSILTSHSPQNNYDIIILSDNISEDNQKRIKTIVNNFNNFSIRFFDVSQHLQKQTLFVDRYFTSSAYARIFIPQILKNYSKAIYIDCDIIVQKDIATLYNIPIDNNLLIAVEDIWGHPARIKNKLFCNQPRQDYTINTLKMTDYLDYFNSGVLVFNITQMLQEKTLEKCLNAIKNISNPLCHDQDILNTVTYKQVKLIPYKYNYVECFNISSSAFSILPKKNQIDYINAQQDPYLIHYAGSDKPWTSPKNYLNDIWWNHARKTPFYEEIILKHLISSSNSNSIIKDTFCYNKYLISYHYHKMISFFTFGKTKNKHKILKRELKTKLKNIKKFISEDK